VSPRSKSLSSPPVPRRRLRRSFPATNTAPRRAYGLLGAVLANWAALVALWALPYLTLLEFLRIDVARSPWLQWSLLAVGVLGLCYLLATAWRETRDPVWRARHGLAERRRPRAAEPGHAA